MTFVGYGLSGPDNGLHFFDDLDLRVDGHDLPCCRSCGLVDDPRWLNPALRMRRRTLDWSSTYDGVNTVSDRFRSLVVDEPSIEFLPLPSDPDFFVPVVHQIVEFDAAIADTTFKYPCEVCGRATQIAGIPHRGFRRIEALPDGFSRTDVIFGSAPGSPGTPRPYLQHPLILVPPDLGRRLLDANLKGLYLEAFPNDKFY